MLSLIVNYRVLGVFPIKIMTEIRNLILCHFIKNKVTSNYKTSLFGFDFERKFTFYQ